MPSITTVSTNRMPVGTVLAAGSQAGPRTRTAAALLHRNAGWSALLVCPAACFLLLPAGPYQAPSTPHRAATVCCGASPIRQPASSCSRPGKTGAGTGGQDTPSWRAAPGGARRAGALQALQSACEACGRHSSHARAKDPHERARRPSPTSASTLWASPPVSCSWPSPRWRWEPPKAATYEPAATRPSVWTSAPSVRDPFGWERPSQTHV